MRWLLIPLISCLITTPLMAQLVIGKVLSERGSSAASVTIRFKNKANTVVTKPDGTFSILATKLPDTLVFSAAGYEPYIVVVTEKTIKDPSFEVVLLNSRAALEEVVVTAAGTRRNKEVMRGYADGIASTAVVSGSAAGLSVSSSGPRGSAHGKKTYRDSLVLKKDTVQYRTGLVTAGEINDFSKWTAWEDFSKTDFAYCSRHWNISPKQRYTVQLQTAGYKPVVGKKVHLINKANNDTAWTAVSDNTGKAELWGQIDSTGKGEARFEIVCEGTRLTNPSLFEQGINRMQLPLPCNPSNTVDIAFVVDATGSMGDEIEFLKLELEDVIRKTFEASDDLNLRVSSLFYRDNGDEYLTKALDFQTDLLKVLNFIKLQRADGGGDTPEAVEQALNKAIDSLSWSPEARSRILFLILDAPPHGEAAAQMKGLTRKAAAKGIRIVPIVCSGADKGTEYLMRSMALATNGTYIFLTDDSGIGGKHGKPTTDAFQVELLNSLLQRCIKQMIFVVPCGAVAAIVAEPLKPWMQNGTKIKIYPNPTNGPVQIESDTELKYLWVTDYTGKVLLNVAGQKKGRWSVNLADYPSGTYLIRYSTRDDVPGTEKIVLVH